MKVINAKEMHGKLEGMACSSPEDESGVFVTDDGASHVVV
jgi:uncharacterized protein YgfB (UPF0149 family)